MMILAMSSIFWWFLWKLCTCGFLFWLGFVFTCHFVHHVYSFDHEMLMLNWKFLKFYMCNLDTLMKILVYGLWFLPFWIVRYDLIFGGVTMYVTPFLVQLVEFLCHAYWTWIDLDFCMLILMDVKFACDFSWNFWMHFLFVWEFLLCLTNCERFVSHDTICFGKSLVFIGWLWNLACVL